MECLTFFSQEFGHGLRQGDLGIKATHVARCSKWALTARPYPTYGPTFPSKQWFEPP